MIVLDASAAIDLLLDLPPHGSTIARLVTAEAPDVAAPHLLDVEVGQVLRRWILAGKLTVVRARAAMADLADLTLIRYEHGPLVDRALDLCANATVYDGVYLALAEALSATLVTLDAKLAGVPRCRARVHVIT